MPSARIFSTILGIVLAALAPAANAQIANGNTYTIGGVEVDVTGPDAVQARSEERRVGKEC